MNHKPTNRTFAPAGSHAPRKPQGKTQGKKQRTGAKSAVPVRKAHGVVRKGIRPAELRERRRKTLKLLYAALMAEIVFAVFTSPALTIREVRVRGLDALPETERAQTLQTLNVPHGTNFLRAPFARLRRDANALPWVDDAHVPHGFGRIVTVNVTPRQPLFVLKAGTQWYETDAARVLIRAARPGVATRLPRVIYQQEMMAQPGMALHDPALEGAVRILQALPQNSGEAMQENGVKIAKIVIDQTDNICLNMRDGMEFKFGQADDLAAKVALVKHIYAKDPGIGQMLASINVSSPSAPACTPRPIQMSPLLPGALMGSATP